MFKKGDTVIYPKHGAGKITKVYPVQLNGEEKDYYKITFFHSAADVSIPIDTAEELGLRVPTTKTHLKTLLKKLYKRVRIDKQTLVSLDLVTKEKMGTGRIEDAISLVNILKSLAKQKEEQNKNFSYSYSDRLENALEFIRSEVESVLGKKVLKKYELDI